MKQADQDALVNRIVTAIEGVPATDAMSALISAVLMLIVGGTKQEVAQDQILSNITSAMQTQLAVARHVARYGGLPN